MKILNRNIFFESGDLSRNLAQKSVRGGMTVITSQGVMFVLNIVQLTILARLLTPADFGLVGMVAVVVLFAQMFKEAGLSWVTIQKEEISHEQVSTLFWVNVVFSALAGLCVLGISPFVAWFYGQPELTAVTAVLSISLVISGFGVQHMALLRRHMQFGSVAFINITSQVVSMAIMILLAIWGWRYWALVAGSLTTALSTVLLTFIFCPWIPGRMRRGFGARGMLMFGGHLTGSYFINYFARNTDKILIGKFIGAEALGIYGRAYKMLMLPIAMTSAPLGSVAVPALSRLKADKPKVHSYYLRILYMLSLIGTPIAGIGFVLSEEIVHIVLGPKWSAVAYIFRYLAIGGLIMPLYITQSWLHIAFGRADRVLKATFFSTPIIVGAFVIGLHWGAEGIAMCYSIAIIISTPCLLAYGGKSAELPFLRMFGVVFKPILSCVLAMIIIDKLSMFLESQSTYVALAAKAGGFLIIHSIFMLLLYRGWKPVRDLKGIAQLLVQAKPPVPDGDE